MTHAALTLMPGVNQNRTIAMNQAAISSSNLIRFIPDAQLGGLPQKLGGWSKFFPNSIGSTPRALLAWADINDIFYLAVGAEQSLSVIKYGIDGLSAPVLRNITPQTKTNNVAVSLTTTIGSNQVLITDTGSNVTNYDGVVIETQISVGGLVLYGPYQCTAASANTYYISATDVLGNPQFATANVTNGGAVATFTTTSGMSVVTVGLTSHGYVVGSTFTVFVSMTIAGITMLGDYLVSTVIDANTFTIQAGQSAAASSGPTSINSGNARYQYLVGAGPLPAGTGFGIGGFGTGGFGSGTPPVSVPGTPITTTDWTLDNYGGFLVACPIGGAIYLWNPLSNLFVAGAINSAPAFNQGIFVAMPQRQIIAWGSTFTGIIDHLLIRWCDINNPTQWTALVQNQAGSYRIPRGSRIIQCIQGPQQGIIWTDLGVWTMQFVGQPNVYSFQEVGIGCGLIGEKAAGVMNDVVYWMGQSQFYTLDGNGVQPLFCPVWDVVFQDLDSSNLDKIRFAANARFGEVSWFYPSKSGGTKYVKYNVFIQQWDFGTLDRTAWINQSVFGPPIGAGSDQFIYQHETSPDADTQPMTPSFTTGYFAVDEGDNKVFIDQVWPDMKWGTYGGTQNANVQITFYAADYPGQTPTTYGPYTVTQTTTFITPRIRTRLLSVKISSMDIGSFWRLGQLRYRTQIDGKY